MTRPHRWNSLTQPCSKTLSTAFTSHLTGSMLQRSSSFFVSFHAGNRCLRTELPFNARISGILQGSDLPDDASISFSKSLPMFWKDSIVIGHAKMNAVYTTQADKERADNVLVTLISDHIMRVIFPTCDIILHSTWKTERLTSSGLCSRKSRFLLNYTWKKLPSMQDITTTPTSA